MTRRVPTHNERQLVLKLLSLLKNKIQYQEQLQAAHVSTWVKDGSLKFEISPDISPADDGTRMLAEGEAQDADGVMIQVLLHVQDGRLSVLEIFKGDNSPIVRMPTPSEFRVFPSY